MSEESQDKLILQGLYSVVIQKTDIQRVSYFLSLTLDGWMV